MRKLTVCATRVRPILWAMCNYECDSYKIIIAKGGFGLYNMWRKLRKFERATVAMAASTDILCGPTIPMCIDDVAIKNNMSTNIENSTS